MSKHLLSSLAVLLFGFSCLKAQVFINEFHYDNVSTDINEGIEVAGPAGTDLSCYKILIYNGANGLVNNTLTLSGSIPDICNGYGTVWFPASLQNGSPDGFALVFDSTLCGGGGSPAVLQFLSYEGTFTAVNGEAIGMLSDSLPIAESNSTPAANSAQLTGNGNAYIDFTWTSASSTHDAVNSGQTFNGACGAIVASQFTFTSSPTGCIVPNQAFGLTVSATNGSGALDASYSGNVTVSLQSGPGSLSGTTTLSLSGGTATFTGLSLDQVGGYVFSASDGSLNGTSPNAYINSGCVRCPNLTGAMIDACGTTEGRNEILFFNSGDFTIPLTFPEFNLTYGTTNPPATTYSNGFTSNLAYVDSLNNRAGCSLFMDGYTNSPIPPNSAFMIMRSNPDYSYDFTGWCAQSPIYVLFSTDANWVELGNFKNCVDCNTGQSGTNTRFFRSNFTSLTNAAACDFTYSYVPCTDLTCPGGGTSSSNGDGVSWPYGGGPLDSAWNECTPTAPSLLPVLYGAPLTAVWDDSRVRLSWSTEFEVNSSRFVIQRRDASTTDFQSIASLPARGNSDVPSRYDWWDDNPPAGTFFYRLRQIDQDGGEHLSRTVQLNSEIETAALNGVSLSAAGTWATFDLDGNGLASVRLYGLSGKVVAESLDQEVNGHADLQIQTKHLAQGVYVYDLLLGSKRFSGKLLVAH